VGQLDLERDVVALTAALVDIPSESRHEQRIATEVEQALLQYDHLLVQRLGNTVIARTQLGRAERVIIGGHLDTVPSSGNLPHRINGDRLIGLGACDMKGGLAVALHVAATVPNPSRDVTYLFYECEEIDAVSNGLTMLAERAPDCLAADFAILMEPSNARIEAGCQGTLRAEIRVSGKRAHSARSWRGDNAIHRAGPVLMQLAEFEPRQPLIDGLQFREGLNAVGISGGVAGNVIPDQCVVTVNYRFAPDLSVAQAAEFVTDFFAEFEVEIVDSAPGALPGLETPIAAQFTRMVGDQPEPKLGWTDVARFTELGVPALNFGPGDPTVAHAVDEAVSIAEIRRCADVLRSWLRPPSPLPHQARA